LSKPISETPQNEFVRDYSTDNDGAQAESEALEAVELDHAARIEALLFVSALPTTVGQLASVLKLSNAKVESVLQQLDDQYQAGGIRIQRHAGKIQLISAPEAAPDIQLFLDIENTAKLSRASLEVMGIVAYKGPVTRPQIDAIRGVNSDGVMRTLVRYGLVEETGRSDGPGRPFLYVVAADFLHHFGLRSLQELPPLGVEMIPEDDQPEALEEDGA